MEDTNKSFDDWYAEESPFKGNENNEDCKWASKFMRQAYEAGQQSRQAEIDNLQKRIEDIITSIDWHIEDCELWLSMNKNDSWKGGQLEILKVIKKRLKGGTND